MGIESGILARDGVQGILRSLGRHLHRHTFVGLPPEFVDFLKADGIRLESSTSDFDSGSEDSGPSGESVQSGGRPTQTMAASDFPELKQLIEAHIKSLGGRVFPKFADRAPTDASFMVPQISCQSFNDIVLVLKSSSRLELDDPSQGRLQLCLKEFIEMNESMEFRCFVRKRSVKGISQRKTHHFWAYLEGWRRRLLQVIVQFLENEIVNTISLGAYDVDVHIVENSDGAWSVRLVDVSEWSSARLLLFSEEELDHCNPQIELRLVGSSQAAQANDNLSTPYESRFPLEMWTLDGSSFEQKMESLSEQIRRQDQEHSSRAE